jgi:hypothetical protein
MRSSAQGLFMLMTNGIGASIGTFVAGNYVVNNLVKQDMTPIQQSAGWTESWLIFASYALVITILFYFMFKAPKTSEPELKK